MGNGTETLKELLALNQTPSKAVYKSGEVCKILDISSMTFHRLVHAYEPSLSNSNEPRIPNSLDSFVIGTHKRVTYPELIAFLERNKSHDRYNS
ncbi:MerR family transcriptional regulator [Desulfobacula toluolica]|uniref:DNA-binding protein n=1 Tax=Desulfobacula toluolica TaxID=28223 RepID=UPI00059DD98F|nr:DNA-binding protein [Desulfobacula toluolica]